MGQDDGRADGSLRGGGGMFAAMTALWLGPSVEDADDLPHRYTTGTLVLWTLLGVLVVAAVYTVRALTGATSFLWVGAALAMFLPLLLAWSLEPPRRTSGLLVGIGLGAVAGAAAGGAFLLLVPTLDVLAPVLLGLAVTALVAAWVFGTVTRTGPAR